MFGWLRKKVTGGPVATQSTQDADDGQFEPDVDVVPTQDDDDLAPETDSAVPVIASPNEEQQKITQFHKLMHDLDETDRHHALNDATLKRFLKARNWNLVKAEKLLRTCLKWRREYGTSYIRWRSLHHQCVKGNKLIIGRTTNGSPLVCLRPGLDQDDLDHETQVKLVVYLLERAVQTTTATADGKVTYVIDMKGWSMRKSPPMSRSIEVLRVFQLYYPERLGHMYVVDAPGWFYVFYKAVSPFIHPVTRAKIVFVDKEPAKRRAQFAQEFDMRLLPREYGGDLDYQWDMNTWTRWYTGLEHHHFRNLRAAGLDVSHCYSAAEADEPVDDTMFRVFPTHHLAMAAGVVLDHVTTAAAATAVTAVTDAAAATGAAGDAGAAAAAAAASSEVGVQQSAVAEDPATSAVDVKHEAPQSEPAAAALAD